MVKEKKKMTYGRRDEKHSQYKKGEGKMRKNDCGRKRRIGKKDEKEKIDVRK